MNYKFSKIVYLLLLIAIVSLSAQPRQKSVFIETNIFPQGEEYKCFISYRIPFKHLVFIKNNGEYLSGLTFTIEAYSDGEIYTRESSKEKLSITDYEMTESSTDFIQGIVSVILPAGDYKFDPIFNLSNTKRTVKLPSYDISLDSGSDKVLQPIVINNKKTTLDNIEYLNIVNFGNVIPFSASKNNLLIPLQDTSITLIKVKVIQEDEEIIKKEIETIGIKSINIEKLDSNIGLNFFNGVDKLNVFLLTGFSEKLNEGKTTIKIEADNLEKEFELEVEWIDKPISLREPEFAINLLENLVDKKIVKDMLSADEEDYYTKLKEFWDPKDPVKETALNEIMYEFYTRADGAINKFATVDLRNGAKTDRGKVYIKYGDPDDIVRTYSDNNEVIEIWKYKNLQREFTFIDKSGLGNFSLY
jgi:GWxTD domain-containing protein